MPKADANETSESEDYTDNVKKGGMHIQSEVDDKHSASAQEDKESDISSLKDYCI